MNGAARRARWLAAVVPLALAALPATAQRATFYDSGSAGPSQTLLRAMKDELQRTMEQLQLGDLARPHFVAYTVLESRRLDVRGTFGALERPRQGVSRRLQVELRAGSREFDDFHFVGSQDRSYRPHTTLLAAEDDYDAIRGEIWRLTDDAYKDSVERLGHKQVYRDSNHLSETLPDLSVDPVASYSEVDALPEFDDKLWAQRAREISAAFREYPAIRSPTVDISLQAQHLYLVDSEGRTVVKPSHWFEMRIYAEAQAQDGMRQRDARQWVWPSLDAIPPLDTLRGHAVELAEDLTALAAAPVMETYLGPVLLEGQAAGELLSQLLAGSLANPREIWVEREWNRRWFKTGALTDRLGLRVISPLIDAYDDPTRSSFRGQTLAGHYRVDEQGIPAQRIDLIEDGILKALPMSRSPIAEFSRSNGHGRGAMTAPAAAMIGNLFVEARATVSAAKLKQRLISEAREFGLPFGLLIRRIEQERMRDDGEIIAEPVLVYRVDVESGEETLVRDAEFNAVTLRALRDIVAASSEQHVYNLAKPGPLRTSAAMLASIVHPSLLLAEMELVKSESKPTRPPYLPHPFFAPAAPSTDGR